MYVIATLELKYGMAAKLIARGPEIRKAMEARGCKLLHAMVPVTGRLNNIVHIWEAPSANHFLDAISSMGDEQALAEVFEVLSEISDQETLVFCLDAPYAPQVTT